MGLKPPVTAQSGSEPPRKVTVADLGAAHTLDVDNDTDVWLDAGVTEDVTLTLSNLPTGAGRVKLILTATGGPWTVTLSDGSSTQDVVIGSGSDTEINLSWTGTDVVVNVEGPGITSPTITALEQITQAAYDALSPADPNTAYFIVG